MYENGTGIPQDASETGGGQEVSAAEKDVWDEFGDFISHEDEIADAKDYKKAFVWYEKAALQGHAHAQYCLAWLYDTGNGVAQDEHQAFVWYEKAALQGHARAQCALISKPVPGMKRPPCKVIIGDNTILPGVMNTVRALPRIMKKHFSGMKNLPCKKMNLLN